MTTEPRDFVPTADEAGRLEALWRGTFGVEYTTRNASPGGPRDAFWRSVLARFAPASVLEVGCNLGGNLKWIAPAAPGPVVGIDLNQGALGTLARSVPAARPIASAARALPFRAGSFDLVFTMGVLIHQPEVSLPDVMREIVRCSRRFVFCGEYFAETPVEVPYRGQRGALIKRDFGGDYQRLFPSLRLRDRGFLAKEEGWSDVTWWMFEKP
jgi:pseudaminic acid biosynthesis-associated methylase